MSTQRVWRLSSTKQIRSDGLVGCIMLVSSASAAQAKWQQMATARIRAVAEVWTLNELVN